MNIRTIVTSALIAALYIAVSILIQPIAFSNIQFRVPEIFNHLVVFNKKYFFGIIIGVLLTNLFFSPLGIYDLLFGVGHSALCLLIVIGFKKIIKTHWLLMVMNACVFTFNMFIIAFELYFFADLPISFWMIWLTTAIGEFGIMIIGIPIMLLLNQRLDFQKMISNNSFDK